MVYGGRTSKLIYSTTIMVVCTIFHNTSMLFNDTVLEDDEFNIQHEDVLATKLWFFSQERIARKRQL